MQRLTQLAKTKDADTAAVYAASLKSGMLFTCRVFKWIKLPFFRQVAVVCASVAVVLNCTKGTPSSSPSGF